MSDKLEYLRSMIDRADEALISILSPLTANKEGKLLATDGIPTTLNPDFVSKINQELALKEYGPMDGRYYAELLRLLELRFGVSREIAALKAQTGKAVVDEDRKKRMIQSRIELGRKLGIDDQTMAALYEAIHDESVRIQADQLSENQAGQK